MPLPQPEDVLELAAELKEARERLSSLEARWKAFFAQSDDDDEPSYSGPIMTFLKQRIVKFLEERPDLSYNMTTVAKALGANENSVGPYLSDLTKEGKIERRERGLYGALRPVQSPEVGLVDDDIPF